AAPAIDAGAARTKRRFASGVRRGNGKLSLAPERCAPHQTQSACNTPDIDTATVAASPARSGVSWTSHSATSWQRLNRIGAAAAAKKRPCALRTPENNVAADMAMRYGIAS